MNSPTLTFGYSVLANRLKNIVLPEISSQPGWDVLITVQSGTDYPPTVDQLLTSPAGERVTTKAFIGAGVTKLRNQVINNAHGEFIVFADDDISFIPQGIEEALAYLSANPEVALLLCQAVDETGVLRKNYPSKARRLTKLNSARAATYEMIVRREVIQRSGVRFDENFGAGHETNYLGDEYIFISDLISAGLRCEYAPIKIAVHPRDSSGSGWGTARDRRARAIIFDRVFRGNRTLPFLARAAFGVRKVGRGLSFLDLLKFIFKH